MCSNRGQLSLRIRKDARWTNRTRMASIAAVFFTYRPGDWPRRLQLAVLLVDIRLWAASNLSAQCILTLVVQDMLVWGCAEGLSPKLTSYKKKWGFPSSDPTLHRFFLSIQPICSSFIIRRLSTSYQELETSRSEKQKMYST